jgi:SOS-response transcriptional repressor LexA
MGAVESETGILAANQSKIELGNNKNPGFNTIAKLAEYYQLDLNEIYKATKNKTSDALIFSNTEMPRKIPVLEADEVERYLNGDRAVITKETHINTSPEVCSSKSYCMVVKDDTMTSYTGSIDSFPMGSVLVVDPDIPIKNGAFAIVRLKDDQSVVFRQVVVIGDKTYFKCINTQYQILTTTQDFDVFGVLIAINRKIFY